jgi:hypothetical protein
MTTEDRGDQLYLDVARVLAKDKGSLGGIGLAMDLVMLVWWPTKSAFVFDEKALTKLFDEKLPARGYTSAMLRKYRKDAAVFFTILPDGRWTLSPEFFSVNDGNAEFLSARLGQDALI